MKADKREIVTFVIAALATLVAVWFFLGKMQKEKDTVRTDLYTYPMTNQLRWHTLQWLKKESHLFPI